MYIQPHSPARNESGEGRPPPAILKIEKSVLIFERKALIMSVFGLNFLFKMQFQECLGEKASKCFPVEPLLLVFLTKSIANCPNSTDHLKLCETLIRRIQNPVIGHYLAIFRHIHNLVERLHLQKPGMLAILQYSELFYYCIPTHTHNPLILRKIFKIFKTLTYLKPSTCSEPSQRIKIEFFAKIVKNYNYFSITLHLKSLIVS